MPKGQRGNSFNDPEVRKRAQESRLSNPHGRRQAKYHDIPGLWEDHEVDTLGRKVTRKEKAAISAHFVERFEEVDDLAIDAMIAVLEAIINKAEAGNDITMPEAHMLGKILDKKMPDLRTDAKAQGGKVTRFIIGAPLRKLVANGATIAGEIREGMEEDNTNGEVSTEDNHG